MTQRSHCSDEACALFKELSGGETLHLNRDTLPRARKDAKAAFLPRAERAIKHYGVAVTRTEIGGVSCLDIRPGSGDAQGTVLYCFGGGFISGSAREDLIVSTALSALAGARVVAVDYRLAPEYPWPAAHQDGAAVYDQLCKTDSGFALAGESAGGNLALTLLQRAQRTGRPQPCAMVLMSPWCDLTHDGDSLGFNDGRDPTLTRAYVDAAAEFYAGTADRASQDISPLNGTFAPDGPPVLITSGTRDLLLSQCTELANRMRQAGLDVRLDIRDGLWHVFEFYDELPEARQSLENFATFLKDHLQ